MALILLFIMVMPNYFFGVNVGAVNNLLLFFLAVLYLVSKKKISGSIFLITVIAFYFLLQFLLLISAFLDVNGETTVLSPTIFRPFMLLVLVLSMIVAILPHLEKCSEDFILFCYVFVWVSAFFSILYVFVPYFSVIQTSFYLSPSKGVLSGSAVGFFATTYFASYAYLLCFIVIFLCFIDRPSFRSGITLFLSLFMVLFSFSKTALLCSFLLLLAMPFFHLKSVKSKFYFYGLASIFFVGLTVFFASSFESLRVFISAKEMVDGAGGGSHSLDQRVAQIYLAVSKSLENYGLGAGLADGILTESFIANFSYRYGVVGLLAYVLFWIMTAFVAYRCAVSLSGFSALLMRGVVWWQICLPVISLSNPVLEMGKGAVLNSLIVAFTVAFHIRVGLYRGSSRYNCGCKYF